MWKVNTWNNIEDEKDQISWSSSTTAGSESGSELGSGTPRASKICLLGSSPTKKKIVNKPLSREDLKKANSNEYCFGSTLTVGSPQDWSSASDDSHSQDHSLQFGATGGSLSLGTAFHDSGNCKPCLFVRSPAGCSNGADCNFCHLKHARDSFPRPSKAKRDRLKKIYQNALTMPNE